MGARRTAREHALQMLYQAEQASMSASETIAAHRDRERSLPEDVRDYAESLVASALADLPAIDALLAEASRNWTVARMSVVDRNILRLAVAELRGRPDVPAAVVLDEAIEIARTFGETDSASFVNGVLEAVRKRVRADERAATPPTDEGA